MSLDVARLEELRAKHPALKQEARDAQKAVVAAKNRAKAACDAVDNCWNEIQAIALDGLYDNDESATHAPAL